MQVAPASHLDRSAAALENAEIHNERLTGQCFLDPKRQKEEDPVPQPALKLQKNCCAAPFGWLLAYDFSRFVR